MIGLEKIQLNSIYFFLALNRFYQYEMTDYGQSQ